MPQGPYDRSKAKKRAKAAKRNGRKVRKARARKSKRVTAKKAVKIVPRTIAKLDQAEVIMAFAGQVAGWHRQSLVLACSAAVALIVGVHAKGKAIEQADTVEKLKKSINGRTGLHDAQVNKYIGLARALVSHLNMRFKLAGPVHEVITATTTQGALDALTGYLTTQKVTTLEGLSVMFGKYRRTKSTATRTKDAERTVAGTRSGGNGTNGKPVRIGSGAAEEPAADAHAELIAVLGNTPSDTLVLTAIQSGHAPVNLAEFAINLCTTEADMAHLEDVLTSRTKQVSNHKPPAVAQIGDARRKRQAATGRVAA